MNVRMSGIDYKSACIDVREKLSVQRESLKKIYRNIELNGNIKGSLIISTCNRTEIYLSCDDHYETDPFQILCDALCVDSREYRDYCYTYMNEECIDHLLLLSCGAKSQIFGEDQIIAQIKESLENARACKSTDSTLEVLFRTAVACAKKIKTDVRIDSPNMSIASKVVAKLKTCGRKAHKILVVGNGKIGKLVAKELCFEGYSVSITVRSYRYKDVEIPPGVKSFPYEDRYEKMKYFDAVVSATISPNFTIEKIKFENLDKKPGILFDLAMPRDIDAGIRGMENVVLYDIDDMGEDEMSDLTATRLIQMGGIVQKYKSDFKKWHDNFYIRSIENKHSHFPIFFDMRGKNILIVGGGKIASRRVNTLCNFCANITVVAPNIAKDILNRADSGELTFFEREFEKSDLENKDIVIAVTNDRNINSIVGRLAKVGGIPVSVADCKEECTFYFPAIAIDKTTVVGVAGNGTNHTHVAKTAKKIREVLKDED